jgi:NAD+ diphosphatase
MIVIQDIGNHVYHNEFRPVAPCRDSLALSYNGRNILLKKNTDQTFSLPRFADLPGSLERRENFIWLFSIDGLDYFMAREKLSARAFEYVPITFLRSAQPRYLAYAGITGLSLFNWYSHHRFCGTCGRIMRHSDKERMLYCEECHTMVYPTICPAVIVAVRHGDKLLVSKYAGREYKRFALIAGFAEIGEPIEATVHREVLEEVGIRVKNLEFYKSQPWPFTDTLLFGFFCDLDGSDVLKVDHQELAVAQWTAREDLPEDTDQASLTMEMMTLFKQGIK